MANHTYFFTSIDPNYRIKGSRDPLGFQSLWAEAGHTLISKLSTVSASLNDFKILSYAYYFFKDKPENQFLPFFFKFEQACAYARYIYEIDKGFNGVDFVSKKKSNLKFNCSLQPKDMLLSNQRAYGIYGKYIRPFRDLKMLEDKDFNDIFGEAVSSLSNKEDVDRLVIRLINRETKQVVLSMDNLECLAGLLRGITDRQQYLFRKHILKGEIENHVQRDLYELLNSHSSLINNHSLKTFILQAKSLNSKENDLNTVLDNILFTDQVLCPINRCFDYLLSKSSWTDEQIDTDEFISGLPKRFNHVFKNERMKALNDLLDLGNREKIDRIISVNKEMKKNPWIIKEGKSYRVLYGENSRGNKDIDFSLENEFNYFINTYIGLYNQIEKKLWNN